MNSANRLARLLQVGIPELGFEEVSISDDCVQTKKKLQLEQTCPVLSLNHKPRKNSCNVLCCFCLKCHCLASTHKPI